MRLSHRLALVFSLFGLAIAGGFLYHHTSVLRRESYVQTRQMAEMAASAVRGLVENQARAGGFGRLGPNFEAMVRQAGIATIVVKDGRGRRLIGRSDDARWLARQAHPGVPLEEVSDGIYDVEHPVHLGARGWATVTIGFHTAALEERLAAIAAQAVGLAAMAVLAVALAAWVIGTSFGLRIERLVPRIEALPKDPANFRPLRAVDSNDEVSRLAAAFNRLGASLKSETLLRRELEREKQELSAMLVHDLKTPLTVIQSGITLLHEQMRDGARGRARPNGSGGQRRTFELLEMSTSRLGRMVEDVLQLARLEEIAGLKERVAVDMAQLARACAKDFELVAADRGLKISLKVPREPSARVMGDPALLRRVIDNLVHNAVEHAPTGTAIAVAVAGEAGHVRVSVCDQGPGVPPEARADLFRKFFQKDLKRHVGNVGLGLALCEKVVRRHDGEIGIEDASPHGACFYFVLPAVQPELISPR